MRPLLAVLACLAAALVAAAPATADSLVFIKENNVWLSNPDGSGAYQVTLDGTAENPYISPSQADDGTIVAARHLPAGGPLLRMRQNGDLINEIPVGGMLAGPFAPQVSPDGQMVAFEHVFAKTINGYLETSSDVRFTRADGSTPDGIGEVGRGAGHPSWLDSGHAFVGVNSIATTVVPGQEPVEWWSDYDHQDYFPLGMDVEDGEVAPNGYIAVVRGEQQFGTIQLYRNNGFGAIPTPACTLSGASAGPAGEEFVDPTFSPTGNTLAWQEGNGIWEMDLPADCKQGKPRLQIPGASEPDWGPAPVNPGPRTAPTPLAPGSGPSPSPGPSPKPGPTPGPTKITLRATVASAKLGKALAKGLTVNLTAPGRGTVSASAKLGAKQVASGSRQVKKAGAATVALRFTPKARRSLAARQQLSLKVAVRFAPKGGGKATTQTLALKLKR
ncbi:MAG TPA: hypothetical protein VEB65_01170 [Solirubrobacterales bacterium]|nr:hypothetical protein [Solirubrobacterales bacterium]